MHNFEPILTLQINRKQIRKTLAQVDIILYLCSVKSKPPKLGGWGSERAQWPQLAKTTMRDTNLINFSINPGAMTHVDDACSDPQPPNLGG